MHTHRPNLGLEVLESRNLLATVAVGAASQSAAGDSLHVPIVLDDAAGIRGAEIRVQYDTQQLDIDPSQILAGDVWKNRGAVVAKVDDPAGRITAFVFSSRELDTKAGSLIDFHFKRRNETASTDGSSLKVIEVELNEGQIPAYFTPPAAAEAIGSPTIEHGELAEKQAVPGKISTQEVKPSTDTVEKPEAARESLHDKCERETPTVSVLPPAAESDQGFEPIHLPVPIILPPAEDSADRPHDLPPVAVEADESLATHRDERPSSIDDIAAPAMGPEASGDESLATVRHLTTDYRLLDECLREVQFWLA